MRALTAAADDSPHCIRAAPNFPKPGRAIFKVVVDLKQEWESCLRLAHCVRKRASRVGNVVENAQDYAKSGLSFGNGMSAADAR